ncbi:MAG: ABC transporter ATP-binding protein [Alkaliphilus sp.]
MELIKIKNLSKIFRLGKERVVALDDISLTIKCGEICCFCGTSGSGKSTLLNMLAGLEKPSKGSIQIGKYNIHKMDEKNLVHFRRKNVGFIFQSYNLLPAYTALENVTLPLIFKGIRKKEGERIAKKVLQAVSLGDRLKHKPTQMSGGQQQRVGIARAVADEPDIVFADEPTGNLDSATSKEVMELITSIVKKKNLTLVLVTHDIETAKYADRVIHLLDGKIVKIENNGELGDLK